MWGRGSTDDKPILTALLMTMLELKRTGATLDRDVIFLAESGEEADPHGVGINFMVAQHFKDIDAEFALTEGGGAVIENGRVVAVNIGTAEKLPARVRLVVNGTSGHGSVPREDNALVHLGGAVQKVGVWRTPMRLSDTTRTYFEKLAQMSPPEKAARYNALLSPATAEEAQNYLAANEPRRYSMLRTSVVPTMLKAGVGPNVIPSQAEATLDIRALPDENIPAFYEEMKRVIGDPAVKIEPIPMTPPSPASRSDTEMYKTLERVSKEVYPAATVLPTMSTGASDMAQLRAKGIPSYGLGPAATENDATNFGAHSDVERLKESFGFTNSLTTPGERFRRSAFTSKSVMFKRVRFFSGQILSAQDFQVEQQYQLDKRRISNRYLHGSGIVGGLHVTVEDGTVIVSPGFALDPMGNEIVIDRPTPVDTKPCANHVCYLFVRYTESGTDPVPAGNDWTEFSRITESFTLTMQDDGAGAA